MELIRYYTQKETARSHLVPTADGKVLNKRIITIDPTTAYFYLTQIKSLVLKFSVTLFPNFKNIFNDCRVQSTYTT